MTHKALYFSLIVIITLATNSCNYYDTTIINIYNQNQNNDTIPIPIQIHPVEFEWHVDEDLIFNTYNNVLMPFSHSWLIPSMNGYTMTLEIIENKRNQFGFGQKFHLLDNCHELNYSVNRINAHKIELYLNNYCHDTMLDLHERVFAVDIIFY